MAQYRTLSPTICSVLMGSFLNQRHKQSVIFSRCLPLLLFPWIFPVVTRSFVAVDCETKIFKLLNLNQCGVIQLQIACLCVCLFGDDHVCEIVYKLAAGGSRSKNAVSIEDTQKRVQFIQNYAENHELVLRGQVPGLCRNEVVLLPSSHSKTFIYNRYTDAMEGVGRVVRRSLFYSMWKQLLLDVLTCRSMTDLWEYHNNMTLIYISSNLNEIQKSARLKQNEFRLEFTSAEPGVVYYRQRQGDTDEYLRILSTVISTSSPPPLPSPGLDWKRQKSLYQKIHPFVPEEPQYILCLALDCDVGPTS
ncbi:hypothetical protein CAPTEDRAFT_189408 [Capitella teleta]|uniref:Uncharacterized protein n=1 Tax=Capitella teleta TaxID=283909 RepID=R7VAH3_CAPTE|nr:hypothetical protein CAPTEDRAFT_189408 [Capitella teleta]|eukprot:ELU15542.1 hypothetical protein CAPTEDRAFT_189408 [Capitella teleta]